MYYLSPERERERDIITVPPPWRDRVDLTIYSCSRNHHCLDKQVKVSQILAATQNLPTLYQWINFPKSDISKYLCQEEGADCWSGDKLECKVD